ncbi:hypothetical protein [Colwellia polaris]|jgi:hypothetical protein|uniref:hypothetical protein n=1 Tax=Colwellia polaris TaxID=326537 RepID=UPI0018E9B709|nr:hypothetical protein [Colwellia polaris]|tara:strand:+ start:1641 stop:1991 length:351 start_codon:yes stop_codon:yes gene_type:complete
MNKSEALSKIKSSLKGDAQVITPKGETYEDYVERLSIKLLENVIDPLEAKVVSTCAKNGDFEKYKNCKVWAIAKNKNSWLLTLDNKNEFALGFGDDPNQIMMHGFSSSDVLGEWYT